MSRQSADVKRLFAETKAKLGDAEHSRQQRRRVHLRPTRSGDRGGFQRQFDTNVLGTLLATREAVSAFDGAGGSVINLSTISSINPVPNSVIYSASKSAIDSITKALAKELGDRKIRVNAIAPGMTETEGIKPLGITIRNRKGDRLRQCRWGGSVSRTTSRAWRCFLRRSSHPG